MVPAGSFSSLRPNELFKKYEVLRSVPHGLDKKSPTAPQLDATGEMGMSTSTQTTETTTTWPKTMRFCRTCHKETPHQLRQGTGVVVSLCVPCLERALSYELDRD